MKHEHKGTILMGNKNVSGNPTIADQPSGAYGNGAGVSGGPTTPMGDSFGAKARTTIHETNARVCVGWFLVVSGPLRGLSRQIYMGQNRIGRSEVNDIILPADPAISADTQFVVIYDPRSNSFLVRPSDKGHANTYINDVLLSVPVELKLGDIICVSDATYLRFVPACDASFKWDEKKPEA